MPPASTSRDSAGIWPLSSKGESSFQSAESQPMRRSLRGGKVPAGPEFVARRVGAADAFKWRDFATHGFFFFRPVPGNFFNFSTAASKSCSTCDGKAS